MCSGRVWSFFFFQAEDGIRDDLVTGVQTCALPILTLRRRSPATTRASAPCARADSSTTRSATSPTCRRCDRASGDEGGSGGGFRATPARSEERRGGKGGRSGWRRDTDVQRVWCKQE